jgi:phosphoribosyl 1,2-cyclic phosphate phosphodiesterase
LSEAVALVKELEVPEAYFTHISHQLGRHETISSLLPSGVNLSFDRLKIHI